VQREYAQRSVIVDCAHYRDGERQHDHHLSLDEAVERLPGAGFVWIGLHEPGAEELEEVAHRFGLAPLAVEDAREQHQRPKIEDYGDDWFVVLKTARYADERDEVEFGEVQLFLGEKYVVVVRNGDTNELRGVRRRMETHPSLLADGPIAVLWAVLDQVVDDYGPVGEGIESDIEEVEQAIFQDGLDQTQRIYTLRRELARFYRAAHPLLQVLQGLERGNTTGEDDDGRVSEKLRHLFRDVADHLRSVDEEIVMQRDLLDGALNANLGALSVRQNDIVRQVSGWAAIGIVPTLVASIYGMNFDHMPELHWYLGYPFALALMVVLGALLYSFLRRWRWL
jgi:magnesium transporter